MAKREIIVDAKGVGMSDKDAAELVAQLNNRTPYSKNQLHLFVGVVGGRARNDRDFIFRTLDDFVKPGDVIVSGGASGVDTLAKEYSIKKNLELREFLPDQGKYPDTNPYLGRDEVIAKTADVLLAFPSKESSGTWYTVRFAQKLGKRVIVFEVKQ